MSGFFVAPSASVAFSIIRLHPFQVEQLPWSEAYRALQQLKNRVLDRLQLKLNQRRYALGHGLDILCVFLVNQSQLFRLTLLRIPGNANPHCV